VDDNTTSGAKAKRRKRLRIYDIEATSIDAQPPRGIAWSENSPVAVDEHAGERRGAKTPKLGEQSIEQPAYPSVKENESMYTIGERAKAKEVQLNRLRLGLPSTRTMSRMTREAVLRDIPFTTKDIHRSVVIHGPHIPSLKGKAKKKKSVRFEGPEIYRAPSSFETQNLHIDIMFVERIPFLISVSQPIIFVMTTFLT
jgi:hypothetical protein